MFINATLLFIIWLIIYSCNTLLLISLIKANNWSKSILIYFTSYNWCNIFLCSNKSKVYNYTKLNIETLWIIFDVNDDFVACEKKRPSGGTFAKLERTHFIWRRFCKFPVAKMYSSDWIFFEFAIINCWVSNWFDIVIIM